MRDSQHGGQGGRGGDVLSPLARTVVARLLETAPRVVRRVDTAVIELYVRALFSIDPVALSEARLEARRARLTDAELIDQVFPAVAQDLGCGWVEDRLGFAEVTLAMSRLQVLARKIDTGLVSGLALDGPSILIVLPQGEQHSFGTQVLASQLRRAGVSVQLALALDDAALSALVRDRDYDCALVSVGCDQALAGSAKAVKALKQASDGRLCVAVGGAALEWRKDLHLLEGADIATGDAMQALALSRRKKPAVPDAANRLLWAEEKTG
jgi:MerR family transcriptional regulator, light-induced transcriptional regulator